MARRNGRRRRDYSQFENSAILNNATYISWLDYLTELSISRFRWENLPATVDQRFLELTLFSMGHALWFRDPVLNTDVALTSTLSGEWDIYNIPIYRMAYAANGYNVSDLDNTNSVIIFNNYLHTDDESVACLYALRLTELDRTVDVNITAQKTPVLVTATENQRLSALNLYKEYDGNAPFIFANRDNSFDPLSVLKTDAPYVADKLTILKHQIINEYLTRMGIENSNEDKRERLVANEVNSNYGVVEMSRRSALEMREKACEQINAMFGLNVSVSFNSGLASQLNAAFGSISPETVEVINALGGKEMTGTDDVQKEVAGE